LGCCGGWGERRPLDEHASCHVQDARLLQWTVPRASTRSPSTCRRVGRNVADGLILLSAGGPGEGSEAHVAVTPGQTSSWRWASEAGQQRITGGAGGVPDGGWRSDGGGPEFGGGGGGGSSEVRIGASQSLRKRHELRPSKIDRRRRGGGGARRDREDGRRRRRPQRRGYRSRHRRTQEQGGTGRAAAARRVRLLWQSEGREGPAGAGGAGSAGTAEASQRRRRRRQRLISRSPAAASSGAPTEETADHDTHPTDSRPSAT